MNEKNSSTQLIYSETEPQKENFVSVVENQYIITENKKLWYFDYKTKELEEVSFMMQSSCTELLNQLNVKKNRPASKEDLNKIKSFSSHTPSNAGFTREEKLEISKEFQKLSHRNGYSEDSYFEYKKALKNDEAFKSSLQNIQDQFKGIEPFLFYQDYFLKKDKEEIKNFQPCFDNKGDQYNRAEKNFGLIKFAIKEDNQVLLKARLEKYKNSIERIFTDDNSKRDVNKPRDLNNDQQKDLMRISTELKQIYGDKRVNAVNKEESVNDIARKTHEIISHYDKGFAWRSLDRKAIFKNFKDELKKIEDTGLKTNDDKSNYQKMYEVLSAQKKIAVHQDMHKQGIHSGGSSRYINILNQAMDSLVQDWAKNSPESFGEYADLELAQFKTLLMNAPINLKELKEAKIQAFHQAIEAYKKTPSIKTLQTICDTCPKDKEFKALPGNIRQFVTDVSGRLDAIKTCHENQEEKESNLNLKI